MSAYSLATRRASEGHAKTSNPPFCQPSFLLLPERVVDGGVEHVEGSLHFPIVFWKRKK